MRKACSCGTPRHQLSQLRPTQPKEGRINQYHRLNAQPKLPMWLELVLAVGRQLHHRMPQIPLPCKPPACAMHVQCSKVVLSLPISAAPEHSNQILTPGMHAHKQSCHGYRCASCKSCPARHLFSGWGRGQRNVDCIGIVPTHNLRSRPCVKLSAQVRLSQPGVLHTYTLWGITCFAAQKVAAIAQS